MSLTIGEVNPVMDLTVRRLCTKPYRNHPKGCPNWNKRILCPPKAPALHRVLDLSQRCVAVVNAFDLGEHIERMKTAHPQWSEHQLRNVLYWQGTARKVLKGGIKSVLETNPGMVALTCPEAGGLLVEATVKPLGIEMEWMPLKWDHHVALVGYPHKDLRSRYPAYATMLEWGVAGAG